MNSIILIGMAGVGKTTVGKALADRLGVEFIDLDKNIESRCGVDISRIFEIEGEVGFREREFIELTRTLAIKSKFVLSVGGGCVIRDVNQSIIRAFPATIIQLYAEIIDLVDRIIKSPPSKRPLLGSCLDHNDMKKKLDALYQERKNYYDGISDIKLDTSLLRPNQTVDEIIELITQKYKF